jgi:hypothetical protein
MPDTDAAGILAEGRPAAGLPIAGFGAGLGVPSDVADHLAKVSSYRVSVRDGRGVRDYLERHPDLARLLPSVCERARQEFEPPDELTIQLYRDPELKDEYLTLYIRQPHYLADILARIERLSDAFGEQLERTSGYLLLTTGFVSPGSGDAV